VKRFRCVGSVAGPGAAASLSRTSTPSSKMQRVMRWAGRASIGLALAVTPAFLASAQQTPQYFEERSTKWTDRFSLRWDFLLRSDSVEHLRNPLIGDIGRWRTELRPELGWEASDRFRVGVRAVADLGSDSNATNDRRFDNYRSNGVALDRAYLEARPGNFTILAGQFGMPLLSTSLLWDPDLQTPGVAGRYRWPLAGSAVLTLAGGAFYGPQREGDQAHIASGQASIRLGPSDGLSVEWAESYWRFTHLAVTAARFGRQNTLSVAASSGDLTYRYDFRIVDSLVRIRFPLGSLPVLISADWARNLAGPPEYRDAFEAALFIGSAGTPGDFEIFDIYQYVDRDALVGAYNTDDWWFHTWYEGHRAGASYTFLPGWLLRPSIVFQRRQDRAHYLNRLLVDLVKMF
jgi:Putative porin